MSERDSEEIGVVYPCRACQENCVDSSMKCSDCQMWTHYKCTELPLYFLIILINTNRKYTCPVCCKAKIENYDELHRDLTEKFKESSGKQQTSKVTTTEDTNQNAPGPSNQKVFETDTHIDSEITTTDAGLGRSSLQSPRLSQPMLDDRESEASIDILSETVRKTRGNINNRPVCHFYKRGNCRHGFSGNGCRFSHPKPCQKLIRFGLSGKQGCKLGQKCPKYHPRLCQNSLTKHECFDSDCKYMHVRGTKRGARMDALQTTKKDRPRSNENVTMKSWEPQLSSQMESEKNNIQDFLGLLRDVKTRLGKLDELSWTVETQGAILSNLVQGKTTSPINKDSQYKTQTCLCSQQGQRY